MGRPRKPARERLSREARILLKPYQHTIITRAARHQGYSSVAEFMRTSAVRAAVLALASAGAAKPKPAPATGDEAVPA